MTYAEAMELMAKYNSRGKESVLSVRPNMEGICVKRGRVGQT